MERPLIGDEVSLISPYISDGSQRQVKFGDGKSITFRHSNELGNFAYKSKVMQMVVLAMREIGESSLIDSQFSDIRNIIETSVGEQDFNHDIVLAPTWVKKRFCTAELYRLIHTGSDRCPRSSFHGIENPPARGD